jgi:hypothetical protein
MPNSIMAEIVSRYGQNQHSLLELVADLTDEQIAWSPNLTTPSIGFHVWHLARWADYLQEIINGRGTQVWERESLAARWNLQTHSLGYAQTGMEMSEQDAVSFRAPDKRALLDYAQSAFTAAQHAITKIADANFFDVYETFHGENWHDGQIGPIIVTWMTHDNRHLGMVECLVGLQGERGSADA